MNSTIESLYSRKSVRSFTEQKIEPALQQCIIEAAIQAPTAGNQVLYDIITIQSQSKKETLAELCDHQPFIAKAPMVLIFLADCKRWYDIYHYAKIEARKPELGDLMLAVSDATIAAQNAVMAAESMGIGSCYIGDVMENKEAMSDLLQLEDFLFPVCMVVFGYPTEQQKQRSKPQRFSTDSIVMVDEYKAPNKEQLVTMLEEVSSKPYDFEKEITAFCKRKYMSDFAAEMNRSVSKYLEPFQDRKD